MRRAQHGRTSGPHKSLNATLRAHDDAEVAALERKLGLTKNRRNALPKSFQDDGLDYLLGGLGGEQVAGSAKRKTADSRWLADKRRKTTAVEEEEESEDGTDFEGFGNDDTSGAESEGEAGDEDDDGEAKEESEDEDEDEDEDELGSSFDSNDEDRPLPRVKENPYAPPTTNYEAVQKYIPPSRRSDESATDRELEQRVRKQAQGFINRLTQANLLVIVGDVEKLYMQHPRQTVSSTVVDLLLGQTCDSTSLSDTLLVLLAGFATALYRTVGTDFGALLVERLVALFQVHYAQASSVPASDTSAIPKQTSNLVTFLAELYALEVVQSRIMFDYVRLLLGELTELNAELLLRVVRMCGQLLRRDDPLALKDLISLVRQAVTKAGGEGSISVRTKFMIETINDLKNNRAKATNGTSAVVSEHRTRMKKLLGTLGNKKSGAREPLGMGLDDILNSSKKGKWWLVGASWAGNQMAEDQARASQDAVGAEDADLGCDADDSLIPDVATLARQNGMNTDVRRAIFAALVLSTDCDDGYARIMRLKLNKYQQREIPAVTMQCVGAEPEYNHYYTLVAKRFCSSHQLRWGFQDQTWKLFRRMGESLFDKTDDDDLDAEEDESIELSRAINIGKMLGSLVASGAQSLALLKCLNLLVLQPTAKVLVENLLVSAILQLRKDGKAITTMLEPLKQESVIKATLVREIQWFLLKVVSKSRIPRSHEDRSELRRACKEADEVLQKALAHADGERA